MNNEFKKITNNNITRYILEDGGSGGATSGGTSAGSITSIAKPLGGVQRRSGDNLINQENKKSYKISHKPKNPVAKAHQTVGTGSGAHADKTKTLPRKEKHKKPADMTLENFDGGGEYNDESGMIRNDLHTIVRCTAELDKILGKNENVAEWVQEKIAVAKSMMVNILDYVASEHEMGHKYNQQDVAEGAMDELHADLSDKYNELAPGIEKYKDEKGADNLYRELLAIAKQHGAEREFSRMCNGARNSAHMDYDTNPGHFKNWFWYLGLGNEQGVAEALTYPQKHSSWSVRSPKKNEFNTRYKLDQEPEARAHAERIGGKLVKVDQRGHAIRTGSKGDKGVAEGLKDKLAGAALAGSMAMGGAPAHAGFGADLAGSIASGLGSGVASAAMAPAIYKEKNAADKAFAEQIPDEADKAKYLKGLKYIMNSRSMANSGSYGMIQNTEDEIQFKKFKQRFATKYNIQIPTKEGVAEDTYLESLNAKLAEKLDPNAEPEVWVQDFQKANPNKYHQFKNKTPQKKAQMAVAARRDARLKK